ncbi:MAG: hypothetical protein KKA42_01050, partial [candidate division Zixibacteria bacterium]|nr:hypothetical protein [candidate division Zixibacteria bacterium]
MAKLKTERSRTQDEIFASMHRELRAWNSAIPESAERLDPILRILLQLYSGELARIEGGIGEVWDVATGSLIRSMYPECKRWPVPAYTVMSVDAVDPVVEVDPHTRFYYREKREGGQTFFFSSLKTERLVNAEVRHVFVRSDRTIMDLSPSDNDDDYQSAPVAMPAGQKGQIYLAVEFADRATLMAGARMFMTGQTDILKQLRWSQWYPGSASGRFYKDAGFCPGRVCSINDIIDDPASREFNWGGLRSSDNLFHQLEHCFAILPASFVESWEIGPPEPKLAELLSENGLAPFDDTDRFLWIRLDLP